MTKVMISSIGTLMLVSTAAWANPAETPSSFSALNNVKATPLTNDEMSSTFGKHLTITNGMGSWEHPVKAFHGTLTITPRAGAVLEKEMIVP
jgi:hypothetical protein